MIAMESLQQKCMPWTLYPLHQYPYSQYSSLDISLGTFKENLFSDQSFLALQSFPLFSWSQWMVSSNYCEEKLDAGHSYSLTL